MPISTFNVDTKIDDLKFFMANNMMGHAIQFADWINDNGYYYNRITGKWNRLTVKAKAINTTQLYKKFKRENIH